MLAITGLKIGQVAGKPEFEAARDMAIAARDENERLAKRIAALEAKLGVQAEATPGANDPAF